MGAYIQKGDLTEGFLHYDFGGLIFGGAYTWRGLFSEFYGISKTHDSLCTVTISKCLVKQLNKSEKNC